jgi:hypothetical protein
MSLILRGLRSQFIEIGIATFGRWFGKLIPPTMNRSEYAWLHAMPNGVGKFGLGVSQCQLAPDTLLASRIQAAYRRARCTDDLRDNSLWRQIEQAHHGKFLECLTDDDPSLLARYLENIFNESILWGVDQDVEHTRLLAEPDKHAPHAAHLMDRLLTLAEALGCIPVENPEQGRWGQNFTMDPDEVVCRIEEFLGIEVTPPEVAPGRFGLQTRRGLFNYRDLNAIYVAWRIKSLLAAIPEPRVCEIGAGMGKVAYYATRMGIEHYTIIDLPQMNAVQAFYLDRALPGRHVSLLGEPDDSPVGPVKILPFWKYSQFSKHSFDLVLNQDSLPEMGYSAAVEYIEQTREKSKYFFLSINQEGEEFMTPEGHREHVVWQLVGQYPAYRRLYRFPFWLRRGYVEELFSTTRGRDSLIP